jgi:tight adherence protein B
MPRRKPEAEDAMTLEMIAVFVLATVAAGGVAWVFIYPILSGERQAELRRESVAKAEPAVRKSTTRGQRNRREQVEETLKDLDDRRKKAKSVPLAGRIAQAGLSWSKQRYFITCGVLGFVAFVITIVAGGGLPAAAVLAVAAALGVPRWMLSFLKKRRETKFIDNFPDAVDIIVRGIKAGLPLLDSIKVIVNDSPEPIRSEFRTIVETQTIGIPLGDACGKLYEGVPIPEANFFGIVISIQQKAGGNLSEALGNLSRVLRDRKKMKAKIAAMSMEAKASATIIAALPVTVMLLVYITSPDYIMLLWTTSMGNMLLAGSAFWMLIGVFVMKKMINFDF